VLFISTILVSALLGGVVARYFSEPLNGRIRGRTAVERKPELQVAAGSAG
jgi:hypothetical protein